MIPPLHGEEGDPALNANNIATILRRLNCSFARDLAGAELKTSRKEV